MSSNETEPRTPCLDDELLAVYLDGRATDRERRVVEAHLAGCESCREWLAETVRTLVATGADDAKNGAAELVHPGCDAPGTRVVPIPRRWRQKWPVIAGLAAAAAILAAVVLPRFTTPARPSDRPELQALVAAVGPHRAFEPRLTGGFAFGPEAPVFRSGITGAQTASAAIRAAAAELALAAERRNDADALAALAAAELVLGRRADAIDLLERATQARPDRAAYWSDLAAARLVPSGVTGDGSAAGRALEAADRALVLSPHLPEALFNRALALDALGRTLDARAAWRACAAVEPDPAWAADASRRAER